MRSCAVTIDDSSEFFVRNVPKEFLPKGVHPSQVPTGYFGKIKLVLPRAARKGNLRGINLYFGDMVKSVELDRAVALNRKFDKIVLDEVALHEFDGEFPTKAELVIDD